MPLPLNTHYDEFIWGPTGHDKFIIKSATELENSHIANHSHAKLLEIMWKLQMPPKVKVFCWLLICECLKTIHKLHTFCPSVPSICVLCNHLGETLDHLLMNCPFSHNTWMLTGSPHVPINWSHSFLD